MFTVKLDEYLKRRIENFAKENNITPEVLIETILYEYFEEIEDNLPPLDMDLDQVGLAASLGDEEFDQANEDYLKKLMGL